MISRTGTHALRALAVLGGLRPGRYAGSAEVARRIRAPGNYLGKLMRQMARSGLLEGRKGADGGFRLSRGAGSVSLFDALEPIEHFSRMNGCFLGQPRCNGSCPLHGGWSAVRERYLGFLKSTTVVDLVAGARGRGRLGRAARGAAGGVR